MSDAALRDAARLVLVSHDERDGFIPEASIDALRAALAAADERAALDRAVLEAAVEVERTESLFDEVAHSPPDTPYPEDSDMYRELINGWRQSVDDAHLLRLQAVRALVAAVRARRAGVRS